MASPQDNAPYPLPILSDPIAHDDAELPLLTGVDRPAPAIVSDQQRLRENLKSAGSQSALGKRYLQKLAQQEDRIEALAAQADEVKGQILQARDALAKKMTQLNIE